MIQTFVLIPKDRGGGLEGFAQQRRHGYICIALKSFYASVECVERNLDPLMADLVVADPTRTEKTICLAVSPSMKKKGVRKRCRVFEIPDGMDYVMAPPRMQLYINYSVRIYRILLRYFSKQDTHVYSIDESFMDVTDYLALYGMSARDLGLKIRAEIFAETDIPAACMHWVSIPWGSWRFPRIRTTCSRNSEKTRSFCSTIFGASRCYKERQLFLYLENGMQALQKIVSPILFALADAPHNEMALEKVSRSLVEQLGRLRIREFAHALPTIDDGRHRPGQVWTLVETMVVLAQVDGQRVGHELVSDVLRLIHQSLEADAQLFPCACCAHEGRQIVVKAQAHIFVKVQENVALRRKAAVESRFADAACIADVLNSDLFVAVSAKQIDCNIGYIVPVHDSSYQISQRRQYRSRDEP